MIDAIELLRKMKEACAVECLCALRLNADDNMVLMWRGVLRVNKHGDKKEWGLNTSITQCRRHRQNP